MGLVVGATLLYATNGITTHLYYGAGGSSATLLSIRFLLGFFAFGIAVLVTGVGFPRGRHLAFGVALGVAQLVYSSALVIGFELVPVSLLILLFYAYPLMVTVGARILFGERLNRRQLFMVAIGGAGLLLAVGTPKEVTTLGVCLGLGAALFQSVMILGTTYLLR